MKAKFDEASGTVVLTAETPYEAHCLTGFMAVWEHRTATGNKILVSDFIKPDYGS